ncbi:winged helix-turn-helix domain-containing protein [Spirosoma utsteinense]|uniref:Transposase n=1 Tax=Spirosoma utsteinense TaxID=2585773 RepID=A0ABR6WFW7_9BACT|nr:winged helix-turn-helix domain-containing protein [Spirosoma utsteinense]MBC3789486.1 transposase [Spirosoma utsteinense]MBC3795426.1 transposase [Spirosoma utsteinense]
MKAKYLPKEYEVFRRRCVELHHLGWKQEAIADAFGLTQGWVSRTLTKFDQQGEAALLYRKAKGAAPRLTKEQLAQLVEELNKGPQHHHFPGEIWTRKRVKAVIEKFFNVSYDPTQVGRILKKVGWSRQKPQKKARQQSAEAVREWRDE